MNTKTQNIVIAVLGLVLISCLWFTFSLFGKSDNASEIVPYESSRSVDLDFENVDVNIEELREKYGENIDSVYAAEFPEDQELDYTETNSQSDALTSSASPRKVLLTEAPKYMIIAGAFSTDANAGTFKKMLMDKGYDNSEIVKFNSSRYTSICVDRTDDLTYARGKVEELKSMNIEAYVHTRKLKK